MYYHFANISSQGIEILREATEDEYTDFEKNSKLINDFINDKRRINFIETSYKEIIDETNKLKEGVDYTAAEKISILFTTYLSLFKKFLDNWETELKRKYGKSSSQVKLFKEFTGYEYDNYMEYRIFYRLRNYDQHCGNLISKITKEIDEDETISVHILMNRDELLNNFGDWKKEEKDYLNAQNNTINIMPLFKAFHNCILRIHNKMIQVHCTDALFDSCYNIIGIANEFENENNISFIRTEKQVTKEYFKQSKIPFNIISMQVPLCKEIIRIYLKDIQKGFVIVSYGEDMNSKLKGISTVISDEKLVDIIEENDAINISGTTMIVDTKTLLIDKNSFYAILVKNSFYRFYNNNLSKKVKQYLKLFIEM